ncbi:hypothetical protein LOK49_LG08G00579 [Camellia lanceoleosa]|uniref:Uncharacterized protein n=1 Tax=Camellia lanceoleosa TaxID=1840588 RepID=A0ACC0GWF1_9ERIC|nr:hypothetical protein LOK49_LG08G00579 [Camellia lanceoleosa]
MIKKVNFLPSVFSVGFNHNLNSPKFQSSIFGTVVPGKSSPVHARSMQPVKAIATEMPPTAQSKPGPSVASLGLICLLVCCCKAHALLSKRNVSCSRGGGRWSMNGWWLLWSDLVADVAAVFCSMGWIYGYVLIFGFLRCLGHCNVEIVPYQLLMVFSVGFNHNLNSPKFQSSNFGTVVPDKSSPVHARSMQPVKAIATEMPPTAQSLLTSEASTASQASNTLKELINFHIRRNCLTINNESVDDEVKHSMESSAVKSTCAISENVLSSCVGVPNEQSLAVIYALFCKLGTCESKQNCSNNEGTGAFATLPKTSEINGSFVVFQSKPPYSKKIASRNIRALASCSKELV